jgi:hypothetical protein
MGRRRVVKVVDTQENAATIAFTLSELIDILLSLKVNYDFINGVHSPEIAAVQSSKEIVKLVKSLRPVKS